MKCDGLRDIVRAPFRASRDWPLFFSVVNYALTYKFVEFFLYSKLSMRPNWQKKERDTSPQRPKLKR